ncbi:MAG: hypothetical protein HYY08_03835 [Firmicutes bacterium]|nr:hypothetical protein [Bacillota bacterium]
MEVLTPDVIAVPCFSVTPEEDIKEVYRLFRVVADEYAARVDWGTMGTPKSY